MRKATGAGLSQTEEDEKTGCKLASCALGPILTVTMLFVPAGEAAEGEDGQQ